MKKLGIILLILLLLTIVGLVVYFAANPGKKQESSQDNSKPEVLLKGVSLSPIDYTETNYLAFFDKAAEVGNSLTWAGKWQDLEKENNAGKLVISQSKKLNMTPVIITGITKGEEIGGEFTQKFTDTIVSFVSNNNVPYLGLGNEIDQEYLISPERYSAFLEILESVSTEVKKASPNTKIFTIYQLERVKGLQGGLFGKTNNPENNLWSIVSNSAAFDYIAFTTYPCLIYKDPVQIPEEYYSEISNYISKPIVFTEIGWFREAPAVGWDSSEDEQVNFINRFKELTSRLNIKIAIWTYLFDQDFAAPFKHIGLVSKSNSETKAFLTWKDY